MAAVPGLLPPLPASPRAVEPRAGRSGIGGRASGTAARASVGAPLSSSVLAVVGAFLVLVGIEVATPDGSGYAQPLDNWVSAWSMTHRTAFVVAVSRHARLLLTWPALVLLALAAAVGLALRTRGLGRGRSLLLATLPLVGLAMAEAVVLGVAHLVRRPYPTSLAGPSGRAGFAFPAAPAAALAAIALTTALVDGRAVGRGSARRWLVPATAGLVVGLAATEAVTASHWASDVAGGLVTGALVAVVLAELTLPPAPGRRPSRPALGAGGVRRAAVVAVFGVVLALDDAPGRGLVRHGARGLPAMPTSACATSTGCGGTGSAARSIGPRRGGCGGTCPRRPRRSSRCHRPRRSAGRPARAGSRRPRCRRLHPGPSAMAPLVTPALPGEGQWTIEATGRGGAPAIAVARLRPDVSHRTVTASLAWMDPSAVRFALIAGTKQPAGHAGTSGAEVPPSLQSTLLAAFNLGFKMGDTPGGALEEGLSAGALQAGLATIVVHTDGTATVGEWGRDVTLGPDVAAVRQNLHLIVDGGQVVPGLVDDPAHQWGKLSWLLPAWRSGVGVDASGHLIYAGGNQLTLDALAQALHQAGRGAGHGARHAQPHGHVQPVQPGPRRWTSHRAQAQPGHDREPAALPQPRPTGLRRRLLPPLTGRPPLHGCSTMDPADPEAARPLSLAPCW